MCFIGFELILQTRAKGPVRHKVNVWTVWRVRQPWCSVMAAVSFFTYHRKAMVAVQGNKVGIGVHQSLEVGRTTVLTIAGIGYSL